MMNKEQIKQWLTANAKDISNDEQLFEKASEFPFTVDARELYMEFGWMSRYPRYEKASVLMHAVVTNLMG